MSLITGVKNFLFFSFELKISGFIFILLSVLISDFFKSTYGSNKFYSESGELILAYEPHLINFGLFVLKIGSLKVAFYIKKDFIFLSILLSSNLKNFKRLSEFHSSRKFSKKLQKLVKILSICYLKSSLLENCFVKFTKESYQISQEFLMG